MVKLDELFTASKTPFPGEEKRTRKMLYQKDNEICRYEFMELLVRISMVKYKDTSKAKLPHEAFEMLIEENLHGIKVTAPW